MACRGFWECLLKLFNFILTLTGLAIVAYGIYLFVEFNKASDDDTPEIAPASDDLALIQLGRPMLMAVSLSGTISDNLPKAWFIYLLIGIGAVLFVISCFGCIGAMKRNGRCLICYSTLVLLLILVELGCVAFIFFDKSWKEDIPTDKTGDFDVIYGFLRENWNIVKWVALGIVIFEALLFLLALIVRAANRPADYDSDDEFIDPWQQVRQPLINKPAGPVTWLPAAGTIDQRPSRNNAWSTLIREKVCIHTTIPGLHQIPNFMRVSGVAIAIESQNMAAPRPRRGRPPTRGNRGGFVPPDDLTLEASHMMSRSISEQTAATNRMIDELQRQDRRVGVENLNQTIPQYRGMSEFRSNNPSVFHGGTNLGTAERWIQQVEKIFGTMTCTEEQKVIYGTFMLQGEAENWWNSIKASLVPKGQPLTWGIFRVAFVHKYFPESVRMRKDLEFLRLQQGNMSVAQYVAKFDELARYSRYLQYQPNDAWKAEKFEQGLRQDILNQVRALSIRNYVELVSRCLLVEQNLTGSVERITSDPKRKGNFVSNQRSSLIRKPNQGRSNRHVNRPRVCPQCGKNHMGACLQGVCFKCRQPGHIIKDCPLNKPSGGTSSRQPDQGRMFTLTGKVIKEDNNLVQGEHSERVRTTSTAGSIGH